MHSVSVGSLYVGERKKRLITTIRALTQDQRGRFFLAQFFQSPGKCPSADHMATTVKEGKEIHCRPATIDGQFVPLRTPFWARPSCAASLDSAVIRVQFPAASASAGATQLPPTQMTLGSAR